MIKILLLSLLITNVHAIGNLGLKFKKSPWKYRYIKKSLNIPQHFIAHKKNNDLFGVFSIEAARYSKKQPKGSVLKKTCKIIDGSIAGRCKLFHNYFLSELKFNKQSIYQYTFITKRNKKGFYWNRLTFKKKPIDIEILIKELMEQLS